MYLLKGKQWRLELGARAQGRAYAKFALPISAKSYVNSHCCRKSTQKCKFYHFSSTSPFIPIYYFIASKHYDWPKLVPWYPYFWKKSVSLLGRTSREHWGCHHCFSPPPQYWNFLLIYLSQTCISHFKNRERSVPLAPSLKLYSVPPQ